MVSSDLVHWKRLPAAVMPDTYYDGDGAFSGSATVLPDGTPVILYTGALPGGDRAGGNLQPAAPRPRLAGRAWPAAAAPGRLLRAPGCRRHGALRPGP